MNQWEVETIKEAFRWPIKFKFLLVFLYGPTQERYGNDKLLILYLYYNYVYL